MELGIYTFGDLVPDPRTGRAVAPQERMRQMLELARLADDAGLDVVGVGEHHSLQYVNSATATTLAAMAAITRRVRLTSASTSIGTADPVRTFQEFATADLISNGRVELILGRGAFTENFPLFGCDLDEYDALFIEKLDLFSRLNASERVTWSGRFRPPLKNAPIAPRPMQRSLPVWIGASSPDSVGRAATLGYPLALPMVGGTLAEHGALAEHYRRTWREAGRTMVTPRLTVVSHLHVARTSQQAREFHPYYSAFMKPIYKGSIPRDEFARMLSPQGALLGGSPQEVIDKLLLQHATLGIDRYLGQIDVGGQPFGQVLEALELFATHVAPVVRREAAGITVEGLRPGSFGQVKQSLA